MLPKFSDFVQPFIKILAIVFNNFQLAVSFEIQPIRYFI